MPFSSQISVPTRQHVGPAGMIATLPLGSANLQGIVLYVRTMIQTSASIIPMLIFEWTENKSFGNAEFFSF